MPYGDGWAICPRCDAHADGESEITKVFGYRTMENGRRIPQSHCKKCRSQEAAEKRSN